MRSESLEGFGKVGTNGAQLQETGTCIDEIEKFACENLPPGYVIEIYLESGSAYVELLVGSFLVDSSEMPSLCPNETLSEQIKQAIALAIQSEKEGDK